MRSLDLKAQDQLQLQILKGQHNNEHSRLSDNSIHNPPVVYDAGIHFLPTIILQMDIPSNLGHFVNSLSSTLTKFTVELVNLIHTGANSKKHCH